MRVFILGALLLSPLGAQSANEGDLAEGKALFRSNCAFCHGLTGGGGRGPALVRRSFLHGSSDEEIKSVIRNGVPGTTMPAFDSMQKDEMERLVAFVRSLSGSDVRSEPLRGDASLGRGVYQRNGCANCHRIGKEGSNYGPDLTRIGAGRSSEYIRDSIVNPSADVPPEFEGVTVIRQGKSLTGMRINEDTFSVQLRDPAGKFHMFQKSELQKVTHETKSLMPPYKLPAKDLDDLLAYLDSLRGDPGAGADVRKAKGIQ